MQQKSRKSAEWNFLNWFSANSSLWSKFLLSLQKQNINLPIIIVLNLKLPWVINLFFHLKPYWDRWPKLWHDQWPRLWNHRSGRGWGTISGIRFGFGRCFLRHEGLRMEISCLKFKIYCVVYTFLWMTDLDLKMQRSSCVTILILEMCGGALTGHLLYQIIL